MNKLVTLLIVFLTLLPTIAFSKAPLRTIEGTVTKVSDGDTIQVTDSLGTKVKVRMYGMDAPETTKMSRKTGVVSKPGQRFGEEAYKALEGKLKRQRVRLDVMATDQYGRTVSIVWIGDRNINKEMVAEGWAWAYRQYLDRAHASEYIKAEEQARAKGLGLWEEHNPQSPWEFRKMLKKGKRHID